MLHCQNLWQPLQVHYMKPKAISMYTVVQSISTKKKKEQKKFKKIALFAFTGLKMKYATNKLQMYISAAGGGWFSYILKTHCCPWQSNCGKLLTSEDPPHTHTTFPWVSPQQNKGKTSILKVEEGREKAMTEAAHSKHTSLQMSMFWVNISSLRQRRNILCIRCCWLISFTWFQWLRMRYFSSWSEIEAS